MTKFDPQFLAPAGVGVLSIAAISGTSDLEAAIHVNTSGFTVGNGSGDVDWNIDGIGLSELTVRSVGNSILDLSSFWNGFEIRSSASNLLNLGYGADVNTGAFNSNAIFAFLYSGSIYYAVGFTSGDSGYIGFRFNPTGSLELYGWAEVVLTSGGSSGTFEVVEWAYDDSGASVTTGVIPEPANAAIGLGALALGAAGLRRMRRKA